MSSLHRKRSLMLSHYRKISMSSDPTPRVRPTQRRKTSRILSSFLAMTSATVLLTPTPAWAHDTLVSSTPDDAEQLTEAPGEVEMTFSADLLDMGAQVRVTDAQGTDVTDGQPQVDGPTVTQDVTPSQSANNTYTVVWRVVSSDGHPIEGTFSYDVGEGADAQPATQAASTTPTSGVTSATSESEGTETDAAPPLTLYAVGGATLALAVLGAVLLVRKMGARRSQR